MYILRMLVEQEIIPLLSIFDFPERRAFKKTKKKQKFSFVIFDKGSFSIYEDVVCWYFFIFPHFPSLTLLSLVYEHVGDFIQQKQPAVQLPSALTPVCSDSRRS